MDNNIDNLKDFQTKNYLVFEKILKANSNITNDETESYIHALVDISEALTKIYFNIIPNIIENENIEKEKFDDLLFDMREQFRHIKYHIKDAKLSKWF